MCGANERKEIWFLNIEKDHFVRESIFDIKFDRKLLVLREYSYLGVYLSAVTIWSMPFVFSFMLLMPRYALT